MFGSALLCQRCANLSACNLKIEVTVRISKRFIRGKAFSVFFPRDIYFQFKSVCRSVISSVIIHRRLKRASMIGCHERTMLISMMEVTNRTMDTARYCFLFCFAKLHIFAKTFHEMVFIFGL